MAAVTGTLNTFAGVGIREDLEDTIWDLFPMDTWAVSNLDKQEATQQFHEWQLDALVGATSNRQLEGDDASYATAAQPTRVGNYLQISRKTFIISGSMEAAKKAGRKSEIARQAMKQMRELKRDIEQALIGNQGSSAGGAGTARSSAGMESWIASTDHGGNGQRATTTNGGSTIGFCAGVVASPTDGGSTGAFSSSQFTAALQAAWEDGGDTKILLVGASRKADIDALTSQATRFVDVDKSLEYPILTSASVYVSDFGRHTIMLSRYVRTSVVLAIDPEYWAQAYLTGRRPFMETLAKTGDAEKRQIIAEFCLVARNPNSSAKVTGLT